METDALFFLIWSLLFETDSEARSQIETEFGGPVSIGDQIFIRFGLCKLF